MGKLMENKTNYKEIFNITNKLLNRNTDLPSPPTDDNQLLANEFNTFFHEKIDKIMANLKPTSECPINDKYIEKLYMTTHRMENFPVIPEDNIEKLFKSAPSKSCELDPLPASLMKTHGHVLIPILVDIVNQPLQQGKFAQDLKVALVQPLLKKANLELIYSNYRPVSNLSILSKLIEWAVCQQLGDYISITNMSEKLQSAYKSSPFNRDCTHQGQK